MLYSFILKKVSFTVTVFIFHFNFRIAIKYNNCPTCFIWPITNKPQEMLLKYLTVDVSRLLQICPFGKKIHLVTGWLDDLVNAFFLCSKRKTKLLGTKYVKRYIALFLENAPANSKSFLKFCTCKGRSG